VLRKIVGHVRKKDYLPQWAIEDITSSLHNEELRELFSPTNTVTMVKYWAL
jgi:hypothetical protein